MLKQVCEGKILDFNSNAGMDQDPTRSTDERMGPGNLKN